MTPILFLVLVFWFYFRVVVDPDLGWHLRVGEYIWQTKTIPQKDLFSFSLPDYPYAYHSWLTETLLYPIYQRLGLWGVTFFYCSLAAISLWLILKTCRFRVKAKWVYFFLILTVPVIQASVYLRVQVWTFLGLVTLYYLFRQLVAKKSFLVWPIPLLFVFWANLHGGFLLGLIFLGLLLLVEGLVFLLREIIPFPVYGQFGRTLSWFEWRRLGIVFLLAILATGINPYGWRLHQQSFLMGTNNFSGRYNIDWRPLISAQSQPTFIFTLLLIGSSLVLFFFKSRVELREKLLILILLVLSLRLNRFSMSLVVVLLPALVFFIEETRKKSAEIIKILQPMLKILVAFLLLIFSLQAVDFFARAQKAYTNEAAYAQEMIIDHPYPAGAVAYLKKNSVPQRLLNDFNWGGYLLWKIPGRKVFIDGRMDNFFLDGESFGNQYWEMINLYPDWQNLLTDYQIEAVLLSPVWPVVEALRALPEWEVVFEDEASVLFVKESEG